MLAGLGLVTAFGHVSARTGDRMVITPAADLADVDEDGLVEIAVDAATLPAGAPGESWIHLAVYRARPDVAAVVRAQPRAAVAAAAVTTALHPLSGQASWLGRTVPVHDDARLLRTAELAAAAAGALADGEALLLRGNGAVTVGASPGLAVARMWLLAAACDAWMSTSDSGSRRPLADTEVDAWRAVAGELLPRLWRHLRRTVPDPEGPLS